MKTINQKTKENGTMMKFVEASYPCLYITTFETGRAIQKFSTDVIDWNEELKEEGLDFSFKLIRWDMASGLANPTTGEPIDTEGPITVDIGGRQVQISPLDCKYPLHYLNRIADKGTVLFLPNYHFFIGPAARGGSRDLTAIQMIANSYPHWNEQNKTIVLLAPEYHVAEEIDRLFQLVDFPLPTEEEIVGIMRHIVPDSLIDPDFDPAEAENKDDRYLIEFPDSAVRAAKGMTEDEIENAFSLSIVETESFDPAIIAEIKQQQIKKSATLEISRKKHKFEDVVGLTEIKPYLLNVSMHPLAQGTLIVGVQGCGKTYIAEALANELGIPAVVVSFSKIMAAGGGLVGQAQAQAIQTFKTLDALAPCVAIFDEAEKGLAGVGADSSMGLSGGSKAGVGSEFLQWIENKTPGVYPIATSNNIDALPPEYKRAGRWDTIMGVDLPSPDEIVENLSYYSEKYVAEKYLTRDLADAMMEFISENDYAFVLEKLDGYSHAELKTIVTQMAMLNCSIEDAMKFVRKIKDVDGERVQAIQRWIKENATPANEYRYGTWAGARKRIKRTGRRAIITKPRK